MDGFGVIRWQPTDALKDAYRVAIDAMCSGRLIGRDALDSYEYLRALECELILRWVVDDFGVTALVHERHRTSGPQRWTLG